jgi:hypothetical protein
MKVLFQYIKKSFDSNTVGIFLQLLTNSQTESHWTEEESWHDLKATVGTEYDGCRKMSWGITINKFFISRSTRPAGDVTISTVNGKCHLHPFPSDDLQWGFFTLRKRVKRSVELWCWCKMLCCLIFPKCLYWRWAVTETPKGHGWPYMIYFKAF